jgi:hypothetical protein
MTKATTTKSKPNKLEGEGSYTATRRYNAHVREEIAQGKVQTGAGAARQALAGPEGAELRRAEQAAKKGPTGSTPSKGSSKAKASARSSR